MAKKNTHPAMQLLALFGLTLLAGLVTTLAVALAGSGGEMTHGSLLWQQTVTALATFVVPVALLVLIHHRDDARGFLRADLGGGKWLLGLTGVAVCLLLVPAIDWLTQWNDNWDLGPVGAELRRLEETTEGLMETMLGGDRPADLLANLLVIALLPAVAEELYFRCGVQNLLEQWVKNRHLAVWLAAAIFSLAHGEVFAFMPRLVLGALLGYLYVCSGSPVPNMLAHFANNAIVVAVYWLNARGVLDIDPEQPLETGWLLTAACTLASLLLFATTFLKRRKANL